MIQLNGEQKVIFAPHLRVISTQFTHLFSGRLPPVKNRFVSQLIKFISNVIGTKRAMYSAGWSRNTQGESLC